MIRARVSGRLWSSRHLSTLPTGALLEVETETWRRWLKGRTFQDSRIVRAEDPRLAAPGGAEIREHGVDREPVQPRGESAFAAKEGELFPEFDKDGLGQFLGAGKVGRHAPAQGMDAADMPAIKLGKRLLVPLPGAADELGFFAGIRDGTGQGKGKGFRRAHGDHP